MSRAQLRELTARGSGGVSVLELRGERALEKLAPHLGRVQLAPGKLCLARLRLAGESLDEVLVWCESPQHLELHLHAAPLLVGRVRAHLSALGFEDAAASSGPRSLEQRAAELLPFAATAAGARMLLDQAEGALRAELIELSRLDAALQRSGLARLVVRADRARRLLEPARVVLAGPVNAGKSTLFNALIGQQRALVSSAAGTTRDLLCEAARVGDWPILFYDSAGERALELADPAQAVEAAGQELARDARAGADIVLWLEAADAPSLPAPPGCLRIKTRADLAAGRVDTAGVAAVVAAGPDPIGAAARVGELLRQVLELPERAHEPGAGVPFEAWMSARIQGAAASIDAALFDELLAER